MIHILEREQVVHHSLEDVFSFFSDAANLSRITPPRLNFKILTPLPIEMKTGAEIDYQIRLFGVPFAWKTLIETFEPKRRFVDRQLKGPYKLWRHTHEFQETPTGTVMHDRVEYEVPLGPLGAIARALFVRRQVEEIFEYRASIVDSLFTTNAKAS